MTRQKKIEIALEAFLIVAALIGLIPLLSTVHKADHGITEVPSNGAHRPELNIWRVRAPTNAPISTLQAAKGRIT